MKRLLARWVVCTFVLAAASAVALQSDTKRRDVFGDEFDVMLYGTEKNSAAGFSLAMGDLNGDSLSDLVIGAPYGDASFEKKVDDAGVTYVFFGRQTLESMELGSGADLTLHGSSKNDNSGFAVATGDLNGDGLQDLIIGAPLADSQLHKKRNDSGVTYVVLGKRELAATSIGFSRGMADLELHSTVAGEYSGSALAAGDVNGDGFDDVIIGGPFSDQSKDDAGIVYVFCGAATLSGQRDLGTEACATIHGSDEGDRLGMAVASADLNGDGIDDLAVGALETDGRQGEGRNVGRVSVLFGRKQLGGALDLEKDAGFALWGSNRDDYVGSSLTVGDVNGDGVADLMVGVPYADRNPPGAPLAEGDGDDEEGREGDAGQTVVFLGGERFSGEHHLRDGGDVVIRGAQGGANYGDHSGGSIALGDVNGDGFDDALIGAPLADIPEYARDREADTEDVGAVFVAFGGDSLPSSLDLESAFDLAVYGAHPNDFFAGLALTKQRAKDAFFGGLMNPDSFRKAWQSKQYDRFFSTSIAAGDFNGDGIVDFCIGAPTADGPRKTEKIDDAGAIYLFWGRKTDGE